MVKPTTNKQTNEQGNKQSVNTSNQTSMNNPNNIDIHKQQDTEERTELQQNESISKDLNLDIDEKTFQPVQYSQYNKSNNQRFTFIRNSESDASNFRPESLPPFPNFFPNINLNQFSMGQPPNFEPQNLHFNNLGMQDDLNSMSNLNNNIHYDEKVSNNVPLPEFSDGNNSEGCSIEEIRAKLAHLLRFVPTNAQNLTAWRHKIQSLKMIITSYEDASSCLNQNQNINNNGISFSNKKMVTVFYLLY